VDLVVGYVIVAYVCFAYGYYSNAERIYLSTLGEYKLDRYSSHFVIGITIVCLAIYFLYSASITQTYQISLTNSAEAYEAKKLLFKSGNADVNLLGQISTIFGFFDANLIPLGVIFWRRLPRLLRQMFLIAVACRILVFVGIGTNKGIGDIVLLSVGAAVLIKYRTNYLATEFPSLHLKVLNRKLKNKLIIAVVTMFMAFVVWFTFTQSSRTGKSTDIGSIASSAFSDVIFYSSQGYHLLSYNLTMPFEPCWGLGNSVAAMRYADRYFGVTSIWDKCLVFRTEARFRYPSCYWPTIFPWIASDVSFPGCLLVMYVWGRVFARCWVKAVMTLNLPSALLFCQLVIGVIFIPCNNQLLQTASGLFAFISLFAWWLNDQFLHVGMCHNKRVASS
jgi:hypothetical protein